MSASSKRRQMLGRWRLPSGNGAVAFLETGTGDVREIICAWDSPPPLSVADERYYRAVVLPELTRRMRELLELDPTGRTLVLSW